MLIKIDPLLVTPEVMTKIAWLKDSIRNASVLECIDDNGEHCITAEPEKKPVTSIIIAKSMYQGLLYRQEHKLDEDTTPVLLCYDDDVTFVHGSEVLVHVAG
jgi:hypothetical protein